MAGNQCAGDPARAIILASGTKTTSSVPAKPISLTAGANQASGAPASAEKSIKPPTASVNYRSTDHFSTAPRFLIVTSHHRSDDIGWAHEFSMLVDGRNISRTNFSLYLQCQTRKSQQILRKSFRPSQLQVVDFNILGGVKRFGRGLFTRKRLRCD